MNINILIIAFFISTLVHFSIQQLFIYFKKFDDFNHRSTHNTLATRTGGIGIFSCLMLISIYFYLNNTELFDYSLFIPLGIMFIVGVYDDFYNANFKLKFLLQIIVAKILIDQGYVITNYHGLFGINEVPWILAQLSTVFVFLVVVNAINFIDGIDGLAITEVSKVIILIEFFSFNFTNLHMLGFIVFFSMLPLYYFNFKKKRKVFLGDSGSLLLGTLTAIYIFHLLSDKYTFETNWTTNKTLFSVLVLLYPLVDLLRVFIIRIKNGNSPFLPDKNHIHHSFSIYFGNTIKSLVSIEIIFLIIQIILFLKFT
jgi:UDP-N-acetylmuramyl pentapeptide phosphotransferase/UDP-N-acetylglucosamine-1-phosphate transferase